VLTAKLISNQTISDANLIFQLCFGTESHYIMVQLYHLGFHTEDMGVLTPVHSLILNSFTVLSMLAFNRNLIRFCVTSSLIPKYLLTRRCLSF